MKLRWAVFWAVAGIGTVIFATSVMREFRHQRKLIAIAQERNEALAKAQDKLERTREKLEFFKTEEGRAWIARSKLNMAFSGEKIYKIDEK